MKLTTEKQRVKENAQAEFRDILNAKGSPKNGEAMKKLMLSLAKHGFSIDEVSDILEPILLDVRGIDVTKMAVVSPDGQVLYKGENFKERGI